MIAFAPTTVQASNMHPLTRPVRALGFAIALLAAAPASLARAEPRQTVVIELVEFH